MKINVGDKIKLKFPLVDTEITAEIERINDSTASFGKCISSSIALEKIINTEDKIIKKGSLIEGMLYWEEEDECIPIKLMVDRIMERCVEIKSCECSVPLEFFKNNSCVKKIQ